MNNIIERIWKQGGLVNIEDLRGTAFQAEESAHTFRIRGVDESGEPLALTGTCAAIFLRADNTDVAITGTITDGAAEITLTDECYDMPGRFGLTIYVTSEEQTVAVYAAIGSVCRTSSGTVSPETGEDVMDLINAIAAAVATIPASYTDLMAAVAPTYSTSAIYAVGSYAWYDGKLYRCTTAITSGETWTSAHWTQANLGSDVSDLESALSTFTGNSVLTIIKGYYITTNGTTYDLTSPVQNGGYCYAVVDVSPGDKFTITGKGGSAPRLWAFGDAVGNILDPRADANKTETDFVIVAPSNATKLILNSYQNVNPVFYAGDLVVNRIDAADQKIDNINSDLDTITTATPNINDEVYENGRFNSAGQEYQDNPATTAFRTKNYIPVIGGKTVKYYGQYDGDRSNYIGYAMQIVQYNSSKEVIVGKTDIYQESSGSTPQSLTLNENTAFVRFDIYKANQEFSKVQVCLYYDNLYFPWYIPHETVLDISSAYDPLFYGKLIAYNGDSICQNSGGYGAIIQRQKYTGYYNNAVGGAHLAHWEGTPARHVVCESVSEMPNDADLICFEGGINDYWGNALIGELTSGYTDTLDTSTICGAMESIFRQAIDKWPGKPICFIIVHKIYHTSNTPNTTGKTFKDYHDAIIAACQKYSIPYIDMFYGSGMNCEIETIARNFTLSNSGYPWGVDGCHPNTAGYTDYYVPKLIEFFRSLLIK